MGFTDVVGNYCDSVLFYKVRLWMRDRYKLFDLVTMNPLSLAPEAIPELMSRLTPRQLEIVGLLAQGQSTKQSATILSISPETVKRHIYRACQKMELENRTQLIVIFTMWKTRI